MKSSVNHWVHLRCSTRSVCKMGETVAGLLIANYEGRGVERAVVECLPPPNLSNDRWPMGIIPLFQIRAPQISLQAEKRIASALIISNEIPPRW
ncbi:hypothetical protein TNCT_210251 [Trichonephila clavata]|uniref:Uncharacterized protein n=1 Tax=Trichonephila clavata TaxID=2740835 RepID=A0A8X6JMU3_TRICU|nr:hypothetical protein TNCT_210251 [Trichonephila clavata]